MDYRVIEFLNNFTPTTRTQIIEFGKRISSDDLKSDVFLVMARKAICFVDLLIRFRLANLVGMIVSERVLDMDVDWLRGKTITIIDDALVSGTSIRKVIDKLEQIPVKSIKVFVLAVNELWFNPDMLTRDDGTSYLVKPINYQKPEKCMQACYDIVKAFSTVPKPYDIDFPLYDEQIISEKKLNELINSSWLAVNVTSTSRISSNSLNDKPSIKITSSDYQSITFFPPDYIENKINRMFGIRMSKGTLKMRTYIRKRTKNRAEYHISFLPFAIIDRLTNDEIDEIIAKLYKNKPGKASLDIWLCSYSSKIRVIQFLIASVFAREFFVHTGIFRFDSSSGDAVFPSFSLARESYIFSKSKLNIINDINICYQNDELLKKTNVGHSSTKDHSMTSQKASMNLNFLACTEKLSEMFLKLYEHDEIKARNLAKEHGKKVFINNDYKDAISRLDRGYTFKQIIQEIDSINNADYIVSVFLDYAIDTGIAVPITYPKDNGVSRAYRHGEDVIFSDKEAKQISYMTQVFFDEIQSQEDGLGAILLEKLFTTFIRLGLNCSIFEKYDFDKVHEQSIDYLRIVYNLHGSTVMKYSSHSNLNQKPNITTETKSLWLRDVLISKDLLRNLHPEKEDGSFIVPDERRAILTSEHAVTVEGAKADRIASTLAFFFKSRLINTDDLILINATYGYEQIIPALLAEIDIVKNAYQNSVKHFIHSVYNDQHALNWFKSARNLPFFVALNSGKWKIDSFRNEHARKTIERVTSRASEDRENKDKYLNWREFWYEQTSTTSVEVDQSVCAFFTRLSTYIYQFGLIFRVLEYMAFKNTIGLKQVDQYFKDIQQFVLPYTRLSERLAAVNTYNENKSLSPIMSYFSICKIDINTSTIKRDDIHSIARVAQPLIDDINAYIDELSAIDMQTNTFKTSLLLKNIEVIMIKESYSDEDFMFLLEQLDYLTLFISGVQKQALSYINSHGKIEVPICYKSVIMIEMLGVEGLQLAIGIETHVEKRRKMINDKEGVELHYQQIGNSYLLFTSGNNTDISLLNLAKEINIDLNTSNDLRITTILNLGAFSCPVRYKSCLASVNVDFYWDWYEHISEKLEQVDYAFAVLYDEHKNPNLDRKLKKLCSRKIGYQYYGMDREIMMMYVKRQDNLEILPRHGFTFGVICAKNTELSGVREALKSKFGIALDDSIDKYENHRRVLLGTIHVPNYSHRILLTQCDQGNTGAAIAYDSLVHFKPDYIFFCGIAGTCDDNVNIGDVFLPFEIKDVCLKKEKNDGFQLRGTVYRIRSDHKGLMQMFSDNSSYDFSLQNGDVMSDNTVYAANNSEILKKVLTFNDKIACIEMESAGLYDADYTRNKTKHGVYTIRGISDRADPVKSDQDHAIAIKNASTVVTDLIAFLSDRFEIIKSIK